MIKHSFTSLSQALHVQQEKSWQQFAQQYPDAAKFLSDEQLIAFKRALTLSDFILRSALQAPEKVVGIFKHDDMSIDVLPDYSHLLARELKECTTEEQLHKNLRIFRLEQMVRIAIADMLYSVPLATSLANLSALADSLISGANAWLMSFCCNKWGTPMNEEGEQQPLLVYGMGKLGGRELNFSSDIDLIFAYPEVGETQGARRSIDNQLFFTRLGQKLISALNQKTADGFVYRVDMRLRPFGESGPLVMTFNAMENYYQDQGRDWERYAMLKARLIGDSVYHGQLSNMLRPFVYRRYIDFSVIESLRRMKVMIAQEVRRKQLRNNIKLGAGGIREIEFIIQVFQMIRGGRLPELQQRNVLKVLPLLAHHQIITEESADVLTQSYQFLRRVENIIQALDDQQTQTLPENELDQQRLLTALQCPYCTTWSNFLQRLAMHMQGVNSQFVELIGEESPNRQAVEEPWVTLWDSQWDDEEAISWIQQISSTNEGQAHWQHEEVWREVAHFRAELVKRSMGSRGRQVLDKLVPILLWHIDHQHYSERTLARVLNILATIATRTAYIELLFENEGALKHLVRLCHCSSWVAEYIAKYPILLDELIDPQLFNQSPSLSSYKLELRELMLRVNEDDQEAQMIALRQFKQVKQLRIAAADVSDILPIMQVSEHLTALAEAIIEEAANLSWQQITQRFGTPEDVLDKEHKGFAVIGYGKLGGSELSYSSDLDLVFVHNTNIAGVTIGGKQIATGQFYLKLAQRMMHLFNTRMANGMLYELDMRLRPSGNSGLLMVHINTFEHYQLTDAWTWEHQALVRTRVVYGSKELIGQFNDIKRKVLQLHREQESLVKDVQEMRDKMRKHLDKSTTIDIDIKQGQGGLVDIEFLVQYLVLLHCEKFPQLSASSENIQLIKQLKKLGLIEDSQAKCLTSNYCQLRDFAHHASLRSQKQMMPAVRFEQEQLTVVQVIKQLQL